MCPFANTYLSTYYILYIITYYNNYPSIHHPFVVYYRHRLPALLLIDIVPGMPVFDLFLCDVPQEGAAVDLLDLVPQYLPVDVVVCVCLASPYLFIYFYPLSTPTRFDNRKLVRR